MARLRPIGVRLILLLVALCGVGMSFYLESLLRAREVDILQDKVGADFARLNESVRKDLSDEVEALKSMAQGFSRLTQVSNEEFTRATDRLMSLHRGIVAMGYLDSSFALKYAGPPRFVSSIEKAHEMIRANRGFLLTDAVAENEYKVSEPIQVVDRGKVFVIYLPVRRLDQPSELAVAVVHLQLTLDSLFERSIPKDYGLTLVDGYTPIYQRGPRNTDPQIPTFDEELSVLSAKWKVRLRPTLDVVLSTKTVLPRMVLWGGILISALIALLVGYQTLLFRQMDREEAMQQDWATRWDSAMSGTIKPVEAPVGPAPAPEPTLAALTLPSEKSDARVYRKMGLAESSPWVAAIAGVREPVFVAEPSSALDAGTPIAYVNDAFVQATGFAAHEIIGKTPRLLQGVSTDRRVLDDIRLSQVRRSPYQGQVTYYRKDGTPFPVQLSMRPVLDEFGKPSYWIFMLQPVAETAAVPEPLPAPTTQAPFAPALPASEETSVEQTVARLRALREKAAETTALTQQAPPEPVAVTPAPVAPVPVTPAAPVPVAPTAASKPPAGAAADALEMLIEASPLAVMGCDLHGAVTFWNQAAERMFGWKEEELIGRPVPLLPGGFLPPPAAVRSTENARNILEAELSRQRKDGSHVDVSVWAAPIRDPQGELFSWIAYFADITDRKRAEAELRRRAEHFHTLIDRTQDIVAVVDADSTIQFLNPAVERALGFTTTELLGRKGVDYLRPADRDRALASLAGPLAETSGPTKFDIRHKDGTWRTLEAMASRLGEAVGGKPAFVLNARDITGRPMAAPTSSLHSQVIDAVTDAVTTFDLEFRIVSMNPSARRIFGLADGVNASGQRSEELLPGWQQNPAREQIRQQLIQRRSWKGEIQYRQPKGMVLILEASIAAIHDSAGELTGYVAIQRDVTERNRAAEALRSSEERYALAAQSTNDGIFDWDLRKEETYYSPRWKSMLGYGDNDIVGLPDEWFMLVHPDDVQNLKAQVSRHLKGQMPVLEGEYRIRRKDGQYVWMLARAVAVRDAKGVAIRLVGSQSDISEQKAVEDQLLHEAFHDALTGLPNRVLFIDRLGVLIDRARHGKTPKHFAVLFVDIDRFKYINDSLGHLAGDEFLQEVGRRLQGCIGEKDTLARYGGDEFVILLDQMSGAWAVQAFCEKLQKAMAAPFAYQGEEFYSSLSVGSTFSTLGYERPDDMMRDADTALYQAKARGRGRHVPFDKSMHAEARAKLQLEADLRRAIERGEFRILYQPLIALGMGAHQGRLAGFEALVRWHHPTRGVLTPAQFLPAAEETGLILEIDRWVLRDACLQMRTWQTMYPHRLPLHVSVNLSGQHFLQLDLAQQIRAILKETTLNPEFLRIELTESVLVKNPTASEVFRELREIKVQLNLDDFGTGYSSFSYLSKFPVDRLKIDKSFVMAMTGSGQNTEIVRTILQLAHNLKLNVVAEGVETAEQLDSLRAFGCEFAQGYHLAYPLEGDSAGELIASGRRW
ncbi:MAG: PAS domain S-box protein [Bryobacteraceae bacterium]|nr:PAS domain S-box protein [Bryobacteraceae bacterium]